MMIKLTILLFVLMVLVGGNRGVDSFWALARTALVFLVNVYLISWGMPPILMTLLSCAVFVGIVLYSQNGMNAKMHAAALSVMIVAVIVMACAGPMLWLAGMSGYNEIEQYEEISMYLSSDLAVSMSAVSLSAVVLGLLGAIMDTAVAVATAVNEVYVNQPSLTRDQLVQSGLSVGRDILGTTVNTLFFVGLGESVMLAVLFMKNEDSLAAILNSKTLYQEVAGLLIGGSGCLLIIPVSSVMIAWFLTKEADGNGRKRRLCKKRKKRNVQEQPDTDMSRNG